MTDGEQTVLWPEMGSERDKKVKAEIIITYKIQYELDPSQYINNHTLEEILQVEIQAAKDDPDVFLENCQYEVTASGRIIGATAP